VTLARSIACSLDEGRSATVNDAFARLELNTITKETTT
jgi:hypothetical protein